MSNSVTQVMAEIGMRAKSASRQMAVASSERKHAALVGAAQAIEQARGDILAANKIDLDNAKASGLSGPLTERLMLDDERISDMIAGLRAIAELPDPVGEVIAQWVPANGLDISRVRTPLGVIGVIFESRPNVTADAGALCLKAGNAVILRGGSDSFHSSTAIHACLVKGLEQAGLPTDAVQIVPTTDRDAVGEMLKGLSGAIDVIVPRGGKGLVGRVQAEARVPVFAHLEGICHIYVEKTAQVEMAAKIVTNAKMRRTSICGAAETVLIDRAIVDTHLLPILEMLVAAGCEIHGDAETVAVLSSVVPAVAEDWGKEHLDAIISVKVVADIDEALDHIDTYSSSHTEAIISEDAEAVARFMNEVDSAILLHNASTQFADGGEFGMGAEIGIATGKMHARGPVGVEQLTSFNYRVHGTGQTRP